MATRLQQVVSITLNAGAQGTVAHALNVGGTPVIPDVIRRDDMGFAGVAATSTAITVRNDTLAPATVRLYLRYYHTQDRAYGDSAVTQLTPAPFWVGGASSLVVPPAATPVPQPLRTANWNTGNHKVELADDNVFATFLGYAWRDLAVGEVLNCAWSLTTQGVNVTWGEIAVGIGPFVAGAAAASIIPIDFTDVKTEVESPTGNFTTAITLTSPIAAGNGIWMIVGAKTGVGLGATPPEINADDADGQATGLMTVNTTAGWRPSLNLGVVTAFDTDDIDHIPQAAWSTATGT